MEVIVVVALIILFSITIICLSLYIYYSVKEMINEMDREIMLKQIEIDKLKEKLNNK